MAVGIVRVKFAPSTSGIKPNQGLWFKASFPVIGGAVQFEPLAGRIEHGGGIKTVNLRTLSSLDVEKSIVDGSERQAARRRARSSDARVPVFDLVQSAASIEAKGPTVVVTTVWADPHRGRRLGTQRPISHADLRRRDEFGVGAGSLATG